MILVLGSIEISPDHIEEALRLSLEHVHRSRTEPGCISHEVSRDAENACRLLFVERWQDKAALATHFAVPASGQFVEQLSLSAVSPPEMNIYESEATSLT